MRQPLKFYGKDSTRPKKKKSKRLVSFIWQKKYSCLYEKLSEKVKNVPCLTLTLIWLIDTRGPASFDVNIRRAVLSRSRLNHCQTKRLAFPNSAGFLPATLASVISLSFSKTGAVDVFASLTAILKLSILFILQELKYYSVHEPFPPWIEANSVG